MSYNKKRSMVSLLISLKSQDYRPQIILGVKSFGFYLSSRFDNLLNKIINHCDKCIYKFGINILLMMKKSYGSSKEE